MTVVSSQRYRGITKPALQPLNAVPTASPLSCFYNYQIKRFFSKNRAIGTDRAKRRIRRPTLCKDSPPFPLRSVAPSFDEVAATQDELSADKFDWFKKWYPVQALINLETDRPNKVKILNRDYIVWKGHSGNWIAMDDECPHRMAPLSEGRIEDDGNLLCSYHAWRFNESGKCVKIPHAEDEKAHSVACNSSRSAVQTYPCKTRGSLLWIWPDSSGSALSDSEESSVPMKDDLADYLERAHMDGSFFPFVRKYPVSYESSMDNGCDPSHFPVTHHGVLPFLNREEANSFDIELAKEEFKDPEKLVANVHISPMFRNAKIVLNLPSNCIYYYDAAFGKGRERNQIYVVPMSSTESLIFDILLPESIIQNKKRPNVLWRTIAPMLNLSFHLLLASLIDADMLMTYGQDRRTKVKGFNANKDFYIPTRADSLGTAFRRWFETRGENGAAYGGDQPIDPSREIPREQVLDRYESHTKHCKLCRTALKNVERFISGFKFLRLAFMFAAAVFVSKTFNSGPLFSVSVLKNIPLIGSVILCGLSTVLLHCLQKLRRRFYYVDYDFTEMN